MTPRHSAPVIRTRAVHAGVSQATRQRMAPSSNPIEASPLDLRGVTVIPRALLEGIRGDDDKQQQQQPSVHQQPPVDIAPRVVR